MLTQTSENMYQLSGKLDIENANSLSQLLALGKPQVKEAANGITIDFSKLESGDSLLLAALLNLSKVLQKKNSSLTITNFPAKLASLAKTYGIDSLLLN